MKKPNEKILKKIVQLYELDMKPLDNEMTFTWVKNGNKKVIFEGEDGYMFIEHGPKIKNIFFRLPFQTSGKYRYNYVKFPFEGDISYRHFDEFIEKIKVDDNIDRSYIKEGYGIVACYQKEFDPWNDCARHERCFTLIAPMKRLKMRHNRVGEDKEFFSLEKIFEQSEQIKKYRETKQIKRFEDTLVIPLEYDFYKECEEINKCAVAIYHGYDNTVRDQLFESIFHKIGYYNEKCLI